MALALIAAPELDARYAALRPTARLIGAPAAALVARGAVVFGEAPLAIDRPLRLAPRLAAFLLGLPAPELRRVDAPAVDVGREDEVARLAELAARRGTLPLVVSGPDAPALLARALDRGLILVAEPSADASLAAAL